MFFFPLLSPNKDTTDLQKYIANHPEKFCNDLQQAQAILVAGGDGFMLDSIKKYQSYQLPFVGVNFGTVGFLMNTINNYDMLPTSLDHYTIITEKLPYSTMQDSNGKIDTSNAINDIIIGKHLIDYFSFHVQTQTEKYTIKGTGLILSTAIGSTAYRYNNGGKIIDLNSNTRGLMGLATMPFHHQYIAPQTITIDIQGKQQADVGIDGYSGLHKNITRITIEKPDQQVQLCYLPGQDLHHNRKLLANKILSS